MATVTALSRGRVFQLDCDLDVACFFEFPFDPRGESWLNRARNSLRCDGVARWQRARLGAGRRERVLFWGLRDV